MHEHPESHIGFPLAILDADATGPQPDFVLLSVDLVATGRYHLGEVQRLYASLDTVVQKPR
jgi:hypothetical protein